jgi:hypothetical protein
VEVVAQPFTGVSLAEDAVEVGDGDGDTRVIRRTTVQPVRSIKGQRPRTAAPIS